VQSLFGVRWWELAYGDMTRTELFNGYRLNGPWIPACDLTEMLTECFSGMTLFSKKEMVKRTHYTDWRSMVRAITKCGSEIHFFQDGPIWATVENSFDAGIARVIEISATRESAHWGSKWITKP